MFTCSWLSHIHINAMAIQFLVSTSSITIVQNDAHVLVCGSKVAQPPYSSRDLTWVVKTVNFNFEQAFTSIMPINQY